MNGISLFLLVLRVFVIVITVSVNPMCESDNICAVLVIQP